ncbi:MAG: lipopolysaccharide biosynthesis protein [Rhizobiales bacterium]|nr:lipopolysaccharide biosynthesis protein [Hyphomicrobiales bacterium]
MLIRQTLLYVPAQLVGPLFQFVAAIVWTHWFDAAGYGALALILAAQELIFFSCLGWWSHATLRYLGEATTDKQRRRYRASESGVLVVTSLLQAGAAVGAFGMFDLPTSPGLVAATVAFTISRSLLTYLGDRARTEGRVGAYTATQIAGPALGFVVAFACVALASPTPAAAIAGFAAAQTLGALIVARSLGVGVTFGRVDPRILSRAFAYGLPLIVAGAVGWVSLNGIRLVVERFGSLEAVGLVSVGWGLGQRLASVAAMFFTAAAYPLALRALQAGRRAEALEHLSLNGALLFGLLAPMAAGLAFVTRPLAELMIAAPFQAATIAILPAAALTGALRNWRVHFFDQPMLLFERTRLLMALSIGEAAMTLAFCVVGLVKGGLVGAVWGCVAATAITAAISACFATLMFGLRLPLGHIARFSAATAAMSLALSSGVWSAASPGRALAGAVAIGVAVYGACLVALYPEVARALLGRLRKRPARAA